MSAPQIVITVNGAPRTFTSGRDLRAFIESLGLPVPGVLVEYNGRALLRDEWASVTLDDGDRLEILRVVAGG